MAHPAPSPEPARTLADQRLALLGELAEIGVDMTRAIRRHLHASEEAQVYAAKDDPTCRLFPACDFAETSLAYNRIARGVRMTLALQARLERAPNGRGPTAETAPTPAPSTSNAISRIVAAAAAVRTQAEDDLEPLEESRERLFDHDEALHRPLDQIIAQICRDLGLSSDRAAAVQARWAEADAKSGGSQEKKIYHQAHQVHQESPGIAGVAEGSTARARAP